MPQIYPAIRAHMGSWEYYVVKMNMKAVSQNVQFAKDVYDDRTLSEAIQRILKESRVNTEITTYLAKQDDRFFSSIVIAALGGDPQWYPVTIEDDERFALAKGDSLLSSTFGVITFNDNQEYFALDGQHRLAAIRNLVSPDSDLYSTRPPGFEKEEISVIMVVPNGTETEQEFLIRYRRLFGNLNRYAKKTDKFTDIIMDEDDAIAIATRSLISQHPLFKWSGSEMDSPRIKMAPGKNCSSREPYLCALEQLYAMNSILLKTRSRDNDGWFGQGKLQEFIRFRPTDEVITQITGELSIYWDAILNLFPLLKEDDATVYRNHFAESDDTGDSSDNALFWTITQDRFIDLARRLLDHRQEDPDHPTESSVENALDVLQRIDWSLHSPPWRNIALVQDPEDLETWKMRAGTDRKPALSVVSTILGWQVGLDDLDEEEVEDLRKRWSSYLEPTKSKAETSQLWEKILEGLIR
jgi:DNA sulfur modification protein DndB